MSALSRRRFLTIAVGSAIPMALSASAFPSFVRAATPSLVHWRGTALGAEAHLLLPPSQAGETIDLCLSEVHRLEQILSLYRPTSALVTLNQRGDLRDPPPELLAVLSAALDLAQRSEGYFDPTIQPVWSTGTDALPLVGYADVEVSTRRIRFRRPGMALTLNGIAQGYVTDRVADLLRQRGHEHILVNLGETRALGPRPDGSPWRIAAAPSAEEDLMQDGAMATSEPQASAIFDPHTGTPAQSWHRVSVACPSAMEADGLSTTLCVAPPASAVSLLRASGATFARLTPSQGMAQTWARQT